MPKYTPTLAEWNALVAQSAANEKNVTALTTRVTALEKQLPFPPNPPPPNIPIPPAIINRNPVLTFNDEFDAPLSVSANGPSDGARWYPFDPRGLGYGGFAAQVYDPGNGLNPFSVSNSVLSIKAWNPGSGWKTGGIASCSPDGTGFNQKYGYFEAYLKNPNTPVTWPAFWNISNNQETALHGGNAIEFDIMEGYTTWPTAMTGSRHWWGPNGEVDNPFAHAFNDDFAPTDFTAGFHKFGGLWVPGSVSWYIDDVLHYTTETSTEDVGKNFVICNLSLGGAGQPRSALANTANPCFLQIDWIRVWQIR